MKEGIDGFRLKIAAAFLMLLDHASKLFRYELLFLFQESFGISYEAFYIPYEIISSFGTVSFFLFAFLSAEGCRYTRNRARHLMLMLLFAILSEYPFRELSALIRGVPYASALSFSNVIFTLLLGALAVFSYDELGRRGKEDFAFLAVAAYAFTAILLNTDYSCFGVLTLFFCHYYKDSLRRQAAVLSAAAFIVWGIYYPLSDILLNGFIPLNLASYFSKAVLSQGAALLALRYNGTKGRGWKYFFYFFYPVHMLLLVWLFLTV